LVAACSVPPTQPVRVAAGLTSHTICSETFISGLDPDQVYAETVKPIPGMWLVRWGLRYEVDRERRQVTTQVAGGFESRAVYRDGRGCTIAHRADSEAAIVLENGAANEPQSPSLVPEIAGPGVVEPFDPRLKAALDGAFAEPEGPPYRWTKAVVVVHDGRVIAERYAPGYGVDTPLLSWSVAKSVTNALLGILVRQGRLTVEQPAPVAAWRDPSDPRHGITVDMLLRMKSGLALDERRNGFDPTSRMLYLEPDMAGFAESAALESAPGSTWNYMSGNTLILSRIVRDAVGGRADDVRRFAQRELFGPLGMRSITIEFDEAGTPIGSTYMYASARDWARFGLLYLNDGVAGGRRILPAGWVRYSSAPTPDAAPGYGAGFWTNIGTSSGAQRRVRWGMQPDSFFANGLLGQFVVVVPSQRLVVVRFGVSQRPQRFETERTARLIGELVAAVSQ
jgi:CubicO group peptidase (beta-lactamase class C family)